jgi:hypothetical protein
MIPPFDGTGLLLVVVLNKDALGCIPRRIKPCASEFEPNRLHGMPYDMPQG